MTVDAIQLNKDIQESRLKTIEYNARVLQGIKCIREHAKQVKQLKEIKQRVDEWRDNTKHLYRAHGKYNMK